MPAGRPRTYTAEEFIEELTKYVDESKNPMVSEFCVNYKCTRETLYRYAKESEELSNIIKRLHEKQEARTIKLAEAGEIPTAWAIFKMKQPCYGWTDKQQVESTNKNLNANVELDSLEAAEEYLRSQGIDPDKI